MPRPSAPRVAALTAGSALVLATLVAAAPSAQAVVISSATTNAQVSSSHAGGCTDSSSSSASQSVPFDADGVARTATATYSNTVTKTGSPSDTTTVTGTASSTAQAFQAGGQLTQAVLNGSYSVSVTSALGAAQTCDTTAQAGAQAVYQFDLVSPAYVTVTLETNGGLSQVIAGRISGSDYLVAGAISAGPHSVASGSVLLPAGTSYVSQSIQQAGVSAPSPTNSRTSASGSAKATITFQKPGTALAGATGDATKYLTMAGGRDCAAGTLSGTWTSKAGKGKKSKIKKAVFYVNGAKVATVNKPRKGTTTTLSGLVGQKSATVEVRLTLAKKKAKKHHGQHRVDKPTKGGGTASLEQSYLPCS